MKIDDALETITRFFNDLIGGVIPGLVLLCGLIIMHVGPREDITALLLKFDGTSVAFLVALVYAVGHVLLAIHSNIVQWLLQKICLLRKDQITYLGKNKSYLIFQMLVSKKFGALGLDQANTVVSSDWKYHDLRSLALSMSSEASSLGRRFMFISLLCNGVGTALLIMLFDFVASSLFAPQFLVAYNHALPAVLQVVLLMVAAYSVYKQGDVFYTRALSTPFPVAVSQFLIK